MPRLVNELELPRCPHCGVANPRLAKQSKFETSDVAGDNKRYWGVYSCSRCGGVVCACSKVNGGDVANHFPRAYEVAEAVPPPARNYLAQALDSLHAPAGAVMLSASGVDAMLKAKGLTEGRLYDRIDEAVVKGLITKEMGEWAHEVRLDANEPRHADERAPLPSQEGARRAVDFAQALAEFLFVLPARVQRGLKPEEDG